MYKTSKYTLTDKMSYLICDNYTYIATGNEPF